MVLVESPFVSHDRGFILKNPNIEVSADIYVIGDFVPGMYYTLAFELGNTAVHCDRKVWGFVCFRLLAPCLLC